MTITTNVKTLTHLHDISLYSTAIFHTPHKALVLTNEPEGTHIHTHIVACLSIYLAYSQKKKKDRQTWVQLFLHRMWPEQCCGWAA